MRAHAFLDSLPALRAAPGGGLVLDDEYGRQLLEAEAAARAGAAPGGGSA